MQEGWDNVLVPKAFKGSSIATLSFANHETSSRHVFYQDPGLHVRDHYMDPSREHDGWIPGEQILALSLSMNKSSLYYRYAGLWHTTTWNTYHN